MSDSGVLNCWKCFQSPGGLGWWADGGRMVGAPYPSASFPPPTPSLPLFFLTPTVFLAPTVLLQVRHLTQDETVHLIGGSGDTIELILEGVAVTGAASSTELTGTAVGPAGLETDADSEQPDGVSTFAAPDAAHVQRGDEGDGYLDTGPDIGSTISEDAAWDGTEQYSRGRKVTKRLYFRLGLDCDRSSRTTT